MNTINKLAEKFSIKLAQQVIPENKQLIKAKFIDLINRSYSTMKRPDKMVLSLEPLSDRNTFMVYAYFGNNKVTSVTSDILNKVQTEFNKLINEDVNLKVIFNKKFTPFTIEVDGKELTLQAAQKAPEARKVRENL